MKTESEIERMIQWSIPKLLDYCRKNNWAGYDPYDGLNSRIFQALRFLHFKYPRLAVIQLMKRSPVNFRRPLLVPKSQNPKGIALFLISFIKLYRLGLLKDDEPIRTLSERLVELSSPGYGHAGWGYNFDWQALTGFVPRGTPNIICTTFAGHALLDIYEYNADTYFLEMAVRAAKFIQDRFYREINSSESFFNYMPVDYKLKQIIPIHNASLLGAALLSRVARKTGNKVMLSYALKAARFSAKRQHDVGSWDYGEWDVLSQRWIDNFHTGLNLHALYSIGCDAGTSEFEPHVRRGLDFYRQHFFGKDGAPKYYHDRLYPIDIHSAAQSIITLVTLKDLDKDNLRLANAVLTWTMSNMWDARGFFYYQKHPLWTIKIPYIRWGQAWMLLALTVLEEGWRAGEGDF
ncbi:MAG: hypothetical protein PHV48_00210 [Candidatus Omnitrophica bacterium]|nr:hypothetical protein [Candidatus Omnitrophota bacterium]